MVSPRVLAAIPHRPPFLFIDDILEISETNIRCVRTFTHDEPFYQGHYPGNPVTPGVILCETIFQAGAILISGLLDGNIAGIPVVTRVSDVKFSKMILPGDQVEVEAELTDRIATAFFLKGQIKVGGKTSVRLNFACTLVPGRGE
ncbi:MAG: beta-hydroxyacyl-ACP dehydratase [Candidatus Wallbacteria bacterium HGW-Wallbacteria-1]|jgi:3-hydroxyacyl-[acyl-carrier-protein] dehydratase|uniref:Beta-hydroxyacyl-ACP dehydratase n=1 Tax=Candidatus Wallbacteria bacterium HGW-Wallbacteria-1 TaxID=2013854 RepID=A0A2N1PUA5_9BACT|nr:MAG: beta-hydroxyacyl-ACP dehydratase [Candidatus Wallbacteria bacterium HGW-Wallbacteria-1]